MTPEYQNAIGSIESDNNYGALGPATDSGDRAYGRYQVMGSNIPDWTEKHYGQRLTPDQFLKDKEAQDAVFNGEFGSAVQKYGNPQDAASVWFSGRPMAQAGEASDGYNTVPQYVAKFNKALGNPVSAINSAAGIKGQPSGALGFANEDDDEDTAQPAAALSATSTLGPGALNGSKNVMKGDGGPDKLDSFAQMLTGIGASLAGVSNPSQANALNTQLAAMKSDSKSKYKFTMGADGTLYRMDDQGNVTAVQTASAKNKGFTPFKYKDPATNAEIAGTIDNATRKFTPLVPQMMTPPAPKPTTPDELAALDPTRATAAKAVAEGRVPLPSGSRMNPKQQQLRDDVFSVYPGIDANVFAARKRFQDEKASSNPTSFGGLIARGSIAADQLDKTLDTYGMLGNTDSHLGSWAAKAENYATSGGTKQARTREMLDTNSGNAATDINSIQNGGRGSAGERLVIKNGLNLPYASHVEQSGAVQAHIDALKAGLNAKFNQERSQLGEDFVNNDPDYIRLKKQIDVMQDKADKLYSGDFSYAPKVGAKAGAAHTAAPAASGLPEGWSVTAK